MELRPSDLGLLMASCNDSLLVLEQRGWEDENTYNTLNHAYKQLVARLYKELTKQEQKDEK